MINEDRAGRHEPNDRTSPAVLATWLGKRDPNEEPFGC